MGKGQKTITITEDVYSLLRQTFEEKKVRVVGKYDATSFTEYANVLIKKGLTLDNIDGRFEIIDKYENGVEVKDYYKGRSFRVVISKGKVFCESDEASDCDHVGFVLADPDIIQRAKQLGVKLRRAEK